MRTTDCSYTDEELDAGKAKYPFRIKGKRGELNNPFHCPTCDELVRKFETGEIVLASKSSPYDGSFDPNIHEKHEGCSGNPLEMSPADLESARTESEPQPEEENPFNQ